MITNKPVVGEASSNLEVESRYMSEGDSGAKFEFVSNMPLGDSTAARFVAYRDRRGGYIDQVAGTVDVSQSARFRTEGTVRDNGLPVSSARKGFQQGADLSGVTMPSANAIVKEDANEVTYEGYRASLKHQSNTPALTPIDNLIKELITLIISLLVSTFHITFVIIT